MMALPKISANVPNSVADFLNADPRGHKRVRTAFRICPNTYQGPTAKAECQKQNKGHTICNDCEGDGLPRCQPWVTCKP